MVDSRSRALLWRTEGRASHAGRAPARYSGRPRLEAAVPAQQLHDLGGRLAGRARVERWLRVILDAQLDRLRHLLARPPPRELERHVDAGRDARGGDDLPVEDHALADGLGPQRNQP